MLGWAGVWCCATLRKYAGAEIQAWGTGLFQAGNVQCIVGEDREGALQVLGQSVFVKSPQEPLLIRHWLRVSPGPPGSILGDGGILWSLDSRSPCRGVAGTASSESRKVNRCPLLMAIFHIL